MFRCCLAAGRSVSTVHPIAIISQFCGSANQDGFFGSASMLWIVTHGAELVISSSLVGGIIRGDVGNVYLCGARLVAIAFATVATLVEILAVALLYAGSILGIH